MAGYLNERKKQKERTKHWIENYYSKSSNIEIKTSY